MASSRQVTATDSQALRDKAGWVRRQILEMANRAGCGHIASSFSCTEILVALYYGGRFRFDPSAPGWAERDRFILSKAQAALALYPVLADCGFFAVDELKTFCRNGSRLGGHAESNLPGVDVFSGSLGHGLGLGCGLAYGGRLDRAPYQVFVLLGDGECHEGSVWESAMFAGHHGLANLTAIIDCNQFSASERIEDYLSVEPLVDKWLAFGWDAEVVDGHDVTALLDAYGRAREPHRRAPLAILARTVKGKGVPFMEARAEWHYRVPDEAELKEASAILDGEPR
jgi:transketolase